MKKNIEICKKCKYHNIYESARDIMNNLYTCKFNILLEDELFTIPKECPYKLEHTVMGDEK